jgi:hypothetical protein
MGVSPCIRPGADVSVQNVLVTAFKGDEIHRSQAFGFHVNTNGALWEAPFVFSFGMKAPATAIRGPLALL